MATKTFFGLSSELAVAPADDDLLAIWDTSAAQTKKIQISTILGGRLTGGGTLATGGFTLTLSGAGGTLALGGFTLTVPATGTAALLATNNVFTKEQDINPDTTGAHAVDINMPASTTGNPLRIAYNGTNYLLINASATLSSVGMASVDFGNNAVGPRFDIGRNTNAGAWSRATPANSVGWMSHWRSWGSRAAYASIRATIRLPRCWRSSPI